MAEAFHEWVNNMPWWERLYYELFDPQKITCSTHYTIPGIYIIGPILITITVLAITGLLLLWYVRKKYVITITEKTSNADSTMEKEK